MPDTASKVRDTANRAYRAASRSAGVARRRAGVAVRSADTVIRGIPQRWREAAPQQRQTIQLAAGSAAVGLAVALTTVAAAGPWDSGQRTAERTWAAEQRPDSGTDHDGRTGLTAPQVLAEAGPLPGAGGTKGGGGANGSGSQRADKVPPPTASALADTLEPLLEDDALGAVRHASVVDAVTGRQLFAQGSGETAAPASTVKLATAVAALTARGENHRIATRVVGKGDHVTLVGGGDPTLTKGALSDLAEDTAHTLRKRGVRKVTLAYDLTRYTGTEQHPIGPNENLALVTPLMLNEGRLDKSDHGPAARTGDPAGQAAQEFADRLSEEGVKTTGTAESRKASGSARALAVHKSATLGALVERMLTNSDNDIAEALARQTALAKGEPASFEGAGRAVKSTLKRLGLPLKGVKFADGSGLNRADRVSPALLTQLLVRAADPDRPTLRPVITGLPVAGFTGTLDARYGGERGEPGAGLVRAKTGTLTGVNTLAGTVVDADGRMLAFAFMTTGTVDANAAQTSLDRLASTLANCGCRDSPSAG
ncbi:D-alanyl-D-alanine carboxypeptidase/D-alanyl-D-alanine-endopeptidase [Streptomyces sp. NBC_01186]|uniref:D-alanyl-D-alanine carboxypeptidase/D-alanyl-D-alanine endopeptidase n=1 Tax=Streptomyces sp. NBC_01186 TaxID=2903765 RepID=UPI002E10E6EF|nr:D-alanyl-D-alanine carboxypeptidase/D-alanyl-D-alanine-endopeptidase [Streptomyces sp. NBC_01186]